MASLQKQKNPFVLQVGTAAIIGCLIITSLPTIANAAPQVIVNDPATGQPLATQPTIASGVIASQVSPTQNPNAPTLAQLGQPNDSKLSQANTQLLATNAELQRQVANLTSQNNVLVNERSGQLFMYGAFTAVLSALLGMGLGWLLFKRSRGGW